MVRKEEAARARARAVQMLQAAGIAVRQEEIDAMDTADFGFGRLEEIGAQIIPIVDNKQVAVRLLVLFPWQTEPEHRHPPLGDYPGKIETIRCAWGTLFLYLPGEPTPNPLGKPPEDRRKWYTVWHQHVLRPGDQVTIEPNTPHWFQGGPEGAIIWSFSSQAIDAKDMFTDPQVVRQTVYVD